MQGGKVLSAAVYGPALRAAVERGLARGWAPLSPLDLERTCARLVRLAPGGRALWVRNTRRAGRPEVIDRLIRASYECRFVDPTQSLKLGQVAAETAEAADLGEDSRLLLSDLRAEAWGNLANCHRILEDFKAAESAWPRAEAYRESGSGHPLLEAELNRRKAQLRHMQGRFSDSAALACAAATLAESVGELHCAGKSRLDLAVTLFFSGQIDAALEITPLAAQQLDAAWEPEMGFALVHNLLMFLEAASDFPFALRLSWRAEYLYEQLASPTVLLAGWFLRGRLLARVEDWDGAILYFEFVRKGFLERKLTFDAALASFDLAYAWMQKGQRFKVQRIATEMFEVFCSKEIPREAAGSFQLFAEAARGWKADLALMQRVARELEPWRRPGALPASPAR